MKSIHPQCPLSSPTIRFNAYILHGDYQYAPKTDGVAERTILRFRYENPDPFIARVRAMHQVQVLKTLMEEGADDPDYEYQFQGLHLSLEYQLDYPYEDRQPDIKRWAILNGELISRDELLLNLQTETILLDTMGFKFLRDIEEGEDGREYWVVADEMEL